MDRKLLINCSNLFVGGGVQVAVSFLSELCEFDLNRDKICIVVSNKIAMQLSRKNLDKYKMLVVDRKPSSLWRGSKTRRQLKELERKFMPEVVFTVFGPAYWRPKCRHIVGFANPWILYPKSEAYKLISFRKRFLARLKYKFYEYRFRQEADLFVVEAEHVKNKLISICRIKEEKVEVVSNTFSMFFNKDLKIEVDISKYHNGLFKFLTISHDYPHKNLNIIGDVYKILKKNDCQVKFFVTISNDSYEKMSNNFKEATFNIGPVPLSSCPGLYYQSDALFLPTLLECYTASYPEAMVMSKPIFTSNMDFARNVCGDAAVYFDPLNPLDVANKIMQNINKYRIEKLIENGKGMLKSIPTARERAMRYIELCRKI